MADSRIFPRMEGTWENKRQCEGKRAQFLPKVFVKLTVSSNQPTNSYLTINCGVAGRQDPEFLKERGWHFLQPSRPNSLGLLKSRVIYLSKQTNKKPKPSKNHKTVRKLITCFKSPWHKLGIAGGLDFMRGKLTKDKSRICPGVCWSIHVAN